MVRDLLTSPGPEERNPSRNNGYTPLLSGDTEISIATTSSVKDNEVVATDFLMNAGDEHVLRVLRRLQRARPDLVQQSAQMVPQTPSAASDGGAAVLDWCPAEAGISPHRVTQKKDMVGRPPTVQFSAPYYYCTEEEGAVSVEVIRFEPLDKRCVVRVHTKDATALAGEHYEPVDTDVVFEVGEASKKVQVPLIHTPEWNTLLEFELELELNSDSHAKLGRYLYHTRVKTIDTDSFPSSKYEDIPAQDVNEWALMWEYFKVVWRMSKVWNGSIKTVFATLFRSVHFLAGLFFNLYLVDSVLNLELDVDDLFMSSRSTTLILMISVMVVLFGMEHILEYRSTTFGVGGAQRLFLQRSVMRKFMNMEEEARQAMNSAMLVTAMTRDAPKLVASGYMSMFGLVEQVGNIIAIVIFQAVAKFVFGKQVRLIAIFPMVATPPCLFMFSYWRSDGTHQALYERNRRQDELVEVVFDSCENFELIADYRQRAYFVEKMEAKVQSYHKARREAKQRVLNNKFFAPWLSHVFFCIYIVLGGINVIMGYTSLGMFLTNGKIISELGQIWAKIYMVTLEVTEAGPSLVNLTKILNTPTDAVGHMALCRQLAEATSEMEATYRKDDNKFLCLDSMPIKFGNMPIPARSITMSGSLDVQQGQFVIIVGAHGSGKASLLRVLSGRLLPREADLKRRDSTFFYPSHLRMLHVGAPLFFDESLMTNLTFGVKPGDPDGHPDRVRAICKYLQVDERIINILDEPFSKPWSGRMAAAEAAKLNVARAFIANPEILILQKPLDVLRASSAQSMLQAFSEFVHEKGLYCTTRDGWLDKRPRTCIVTATKPSDVKFADQVFFIDSNSRISKQYPGRLDPAAFA